ncbi:MAG: alpha/beta hydrolase [Nocardioides sp.]|uniref:alpha/beta fold hydrolase n=1 Tax=Nocardioides sp. TaxID=35761 RepID=UPI0039E3DE65
MSVFSVPGAELDVELSDEGGHPVVQLHGLTSSRRRDRLLNLDLGRGLSGTRLLRYDARGHGRSTGRPVSDDYRWPVLAEDLLALLESWFPGERVHGVGPSMGCATLLHAAVLDPDRFAGFTLMLPPTAWATRAARATTYRAEADAVERDGMKAFLAADREEKPPPATVGRPVTLPEIREALLPSVLRGAAASDLPDAARIAAIAVPTTVLAWIDDPGHPVSTAQELVRLMPSAALEIAGTPAEVDRWPETLHDDVARHG